MNYNYKEEWFKRSKDNTFGITICHWELSTIGQMWGIYCYIYPEHELFKKLENNMSSGELINNFHGGCTYVSWHYNTETKVSSKQYGCDYAHLHDDRFHKYKTKDEAYEVFRDAELLYKELDGIIDS